MNNKSKYLLCLAFFAGPIFTFGQDFLPALNDNFMGINQAFLQPASIADSRFRTDFNIGGFSNDISNDAIRFKSRWLLYPTDILTNDDWWDENTYISEKNGKDDNVFMSQSAVGPSFMVSLDSTGKSALGFTSRVRSVLNIDDMSEPLFRLIYSNYTEQEFYNKWYFDEKMRSSQHIFGDYGLTYARVIPIDSSRQHFLKAGITVKLLQGIAASYMQTDELYYYFNGQDYPQAKNMSYNSTYVHAGLSDNWGELNQYGNYTFSMNYQLTAKPSAGLDFGVVYEWRPKRIKYGHRQNQYDTIIRPVKNKYFLKIGISVLDLGRLKYTKDYNSADYIAASTPDYLNRYNTGDNSVPDNTYWLDANEVSYSFRDYADFSNTIHERSVNGEGIQKATGNKEYFTVRLPAAISLQADLNLFLEGLYVNVTTYHALNQGNSHVPNSHYISTYSITPRYEKKWYGVSVPVIINQYGKVDVGLGARVGVVYFGVNNLFSNVFKDTYGIHAYVGVKVPVPYKDPTKLPKEKVTKVKIVNCPPCDCCKRDSSDFSRMEGLPGSIQVNANHSIVNINSFNTNGSTISTSTSTSESESNTSETQTTNVTPEKPVDTGTIENNEVYFDFNSSKIRQGDYPVLDEIIQHLLSNPKSNAVLTGFTDSIDTDEYNLVLSKKRTQSVYNYMINSGVNPNQLKQDWKGEENPKGDNNTATGRQINRRVEIVLIE